MNAFVDMHDIGDALTRNGLADPVLSTEHLTLTYSDARQLMRELKHTGAVNINAGRRRSLTGKHRWRRMLKRYEVYRRDGALPVTCEVIYGHAWALGPPRGDKAARPISLKPCGRACENAAAGLMEARPGLSLPATGNLCFKRHAYGVDIPGARVSPLGLPCPRQTDFVHLQSLCSNPLVEPGHARQGDNLPRSCKPGAIFSRRYLIVRIPAFADAVSLPLADHVVDLALQQRHVAMAPGPGQRFCRNPAGVETRRAVCVQQPRAHWIRCRNCGRVGARSMTMCM